MKPIEVPDYEDERVYVPFTVPQKGRKPLVFKVPRKDFQPPEDVKTLQWLMTEFDFDEDKLGEYIDLDNEITRDISIEMACWLLALKPHVTETQFKALKKCSYGQLRFIHQRWNEQSRVTLGEYWASANSSMGNTEAQSTQTSKSDSDTPDGTSDDDSDGQTSETG